MRSYGESILASALHQLSRRLPRSEPSTRKLRAKASWLSCLPWCVPTHLPM